MKTTEKQVLDKRVNDDVETLKGDISRLRDDMTNIARSIRSRVKDRAKKEPQAAVEVPSPASATEVHVEELKPRRRRFVVKWPRLSTRKAVGIFAAGLIAALLVTRKRRSVVLEAPETGGRRRSRLTAFVPWVGKSRRRETVAVVEHEPIEP